MGIHWWIHTASGLPPSPFQGSIQQHTSSARTIVEQVRWLSAAEVLCATVCSSNQDMQDLISRTVAAWSRPKPSVSQSMSALHSETQCQCTVATANDHSVDLELREAHLPFFGAVRLSIAEAQIGARSFPGANLCGRCQVHFLWKQGGAHTPSLSIKQCQGFNGDSVRVYLCIGLSFPPLPQRTLLLSIAGQGFTRTVRHSYLISVHGQFKTAADILWCRIPGNCMWNRGIDTSRIIRCWLHSPRQWRWPGKCEGTRKKSHL